MFNKEMFLTQMAALRESVYAADQIGDLTGGCGAANGPLTKYLDISHDLWVKIFQISEDFEDFFCEDFWNMVYEKTAICAGTEGIEAFYDFYSQPELVFPDSAYNFH